MVEVKEDIQLKEEIKEEIILPIIESGVDLENVISSVKNEDDEFIEALVNVTKERNNPVKCDSDKKSSILTSLVKSCHDLDVRMNVTEEKTEVKTQGEDLPQTSHEAGSKNEIMEVLSEEYETNELEGELEGGNMEDGNVDCVVSFEPELCPLELLEDSNFDNNEHKSEETFECGDSLLKEVKNNRAKGKKKPKHRCNECGMEFQYKANCAKHEKLHEDEFRFKCKYCNISFKQSLTLKNHYSYVHETEKPHRCEYCDSSFKSMNNLKSHIEVHHNISGETFPCDFCHMEFKRKCYLKRHLSIHTNPDKKFTCADCGLKCRSKTDIAKHVLTHIGVVEKHFFCDICGTGFSKQAHVARHVRTHSVEKSFPCELCDRAYKDQYSLKTHHETVHLGITFSCEICGFQSDRHSLKKHLKRCEGQKKYTCEVCHKEYFLKKWFEQHTSKCNFKR